ncbi:MAG: hypothetical protein MHM6MM_007041 [Cercozoa sp. M6MM]
MLAESRVAELARQSPSVAVSQELLQLLKQFRVNEPELTVKHAEHVLKHASLSKLERAQLLEQAAHAAVHVDIEAASTFITEFQRLIGTTCSSARVLEGMLAEARGDNRSAVQLYQQVLDEEDANLVARHRIVAVLLAQNKVSQAVQTLNEHVAVFAADADAWQQLLHLHLAHAGNEDNESLAHAQFCAEELVLLRPEDYLSHLQLAEIHARRSSKSEKRLALRYFLQSLSLESRVNLRASFGVLQTVEALGSDDDAQDVSTEVLVRSRALLRDADDATLRLCQLDADVVARLASSAGTGDADDNKED